MHTRACERSQAANGQCHQRVTLQTFEVVPLAFTAAVQARGNVGVALQTLTCTRQYRRNGCPQPAGKLSYDAHTS